MKVYEVIYHGYHECQSSDCCAGWDPEDASEGLFATLKSAKAAADAQQTFLKGEKWVDDGHGRWTRGRHEVKEREVRP